MPGVPTDCQQYMLMCLVVGSRYGRGWDCCCFRWHDTVEKGKGQGSRGKGTRDETAHATGRRRYEGTRSKGWVVWWCEWVWWWCRHSEKIRLLPLA